MIEAAARRDAFLSKMDDDFNSGAAVSELFQLARQLNKFVDSAKLEDASVRQPSDLKSFQRGCKTLKELSAILGLFLQPIVAEQGQEDELLNGLMQLLIAIRKEAREKKDFATSDKVRDELARLKIVLEDRKGETTWRRE